MDLEVTCKMDFGLDPVARIIFLIITFCNPTISSFLIPASRCIIVTMDMYSVQEASHQLNLDHSQVRRLLRSGDIEGKKWGRDWMVLSLDYKRKRKPKNEKGGG